jgi:tetratricopeptide (TPR) repeat protein
MSEANDYVAIVSGLWDRVQSNEESVKERVKIIEETENLLKDEKFLENRFLVTKVKLIQYKAGKPYNLEELIKEFTAEAETKEGITNVDLYICMAETYLHDGKPEEARKILEENTQVDPTPEVYNILSLCYRRRKDVDLAKSLDYANKSVRLDMKNGKSWVNLSLAYLARSGRENVLQAEKALKMALRHGEDKNADTIMNLGTVNELLLKFGEALKYYEQAMVMSDGWALPAENLVRLQDMILKAISFGDLAAKSKKMKKEWLPRLKEEDEYVVVDTAAQPEDPCQLVVCVNKEAEIKYVAITATVRAYFFFGKTVIKIPKTNFINLEVKDKSIEYHIIENLKDIQIVSGGIKPNEVKPVSISSSLA